jgi:hypothetical protein
MIRWKNIKDCHALRNRARNDVIAQSTIEFAFAMIIIMFLIYGMVQVFRWAGMDLAQRRYIQDTSITASPTSGDPGQTQLTSGDDIAQPMAAVYHGTISGNTVGNIN